ncbi:MAG TPA: hypothetical protein PKC72_08900 [Chitinophagaceae bacterium]|nr:hypothetical protein [Chitinophagaceae bacterium]
MKEKRIHLVGRIDQIVRDYFEKNKSVKEIMAKDLMPLLIKKGIFKKDHRKGLPIRKILRELDTDNKSYLIKNLRVEQKSINRNWYFIKN